MKSLPLGYTLTGQENRGIKCPNRVVFLILERSTKKVTLLGRKVIFIKVGYVRVSTIGQNTARQEVLMQELGVERVFIDHQSGKDASRPELQKLLEFVREGDVVVVESISRFARCTKDLLELIEQLTAKGVEFISKKESLDTSTPSGRFVLTIFGAVAQLEREYLLQRQKEGIAIAKQEGKYKGRKPIECPEFTTVVMQWRAGEIMAVEAMRRLGMSSSTFYRKIKELNFEK